MKSSDFVREFGEFVDSVATKNGHLLILGDFNIHWDCPEKSDTIHLSDTLASANLIQHVKEPTHVAGHIIDLVISREGDDFVKSVSVSSQFSDHFIINVSVSLEKPPVTTKTITYRKVRSIDMSGFAADIQTSALILDPPSGLDELVDTYNEILTDLLDKHAPLKTKQMTERPLLPWYNKDIQAAKRHRRQCELLWKRTGLTVHYDMFKAARLFVREQLSSAKSQFYNENIAKCNGDQKTVFSVVNKVLHRKKSIQKILTIRDNLQLSKDNPVPHIPSGEVSCESCMATFEPFTGVEIRKLLAKSSSAFCELDPVPTELVKSCQDVLLTPVTMIINVSLQTGVFPTSMKSARVKPLIKKQDLDCNTLKNYRPVSNLSFISKLIERAAAMRLKTYLSNNNLNEPFQSAYKACHSTETALIRVKNDIMWQWMVRRQ